MARHPVRTVKRVKLIPPARSNCPQWIENVNKSYRRFPTALRGDQPVNPLFRLNTDGLIVTHNACQTLIHHTLAATDFQNSSRPTHSFATNRHARWTIQTFPPRTSCDDTKGKLILVVRCEKEDMQGTLSLCMNLAVLAAVHGP